ncbi:MAG: YifB family Mg chelatase-like AAA ATPase [Elusimicrobiota bacterium]|jgi:magnesium chelatase family protein|nr:YifB family Mg chelatase-like AAA ATPase [Elusimicrobiota bacterium]
MVSLVYSAAILGIEASVVEVEVYISNGMPRFSIVGLADIAIKESRDRIFAAIKNSGFNFPFKRITVNLAPANTKKEGGAFDLPIALGILASMGKVDQERLKSFCAVGELALDGKIRRINGALPIALGIKKDLKDIIVPFGNRQEAAVIKDINVYPFNTLNEVVDFINGMQCEPFIYDPDKDNTDYFDFENDFEDIKGQFTARRAAEIAAAGSHNMIMSGPPGAGKTMIAKRIPGILPFMSFDESIETTKIWSAAGKSFSGGLIRIRPFRSPHHTTSPVALAGGGTYPKPGEVSLASNGILFLDEFAEFRRDSLEILRQPLEDKCITISRAKIVLTFPASFMLVAAMNPCPCGNLGNTQKECICNEHQVQKYRNRISGPLLDRIDIHIDVPALKTSELTSMNEKSESSQSIRKRVIEARNIQTERFKGLKIYANGQMGVKDIKVHCISDDKAKQILKSAIDKLNLSARAYDRVLKVSRTIADLDKSEIIKGVHAAEAVHYRLIDRN